MQKKKVFIKYSLRVNLDFECIDLVTGPKLTFEKWEYRMNMKHVKQFWNTACFIELKH